MLLTGPEWTGVINGAHNAASDVKILDGLLEHLNVGHEVLRSSALSARDFFLRQVRFGLSTSLVYYHLDAR